jgi:hypothetical protein
VRDRQPVWPPPPGDARPPAGRSRPAPASDRSGRQRRGRQRRAALPGAHPEAHRSMARRARCSDHTRPAGR